MSAASLPWFARHEARLAWRDFIGLTTGGKRGRTIVLVVVLAAVYAGLHLLAWALIAPRLAAGGIGLDKATLVLLTGSAFLFCTVMLSQAMESVTRAYYGRADLDLLLSSPASAGRVFAVRTGGTALAAILLSTMLASPGINVLVRLDGPHWLAAYGVLAAMGALAAALAVFATSGLFRLVGPRRTRLIAQIVAGIVGAGFIIGIQVAAILGFGDMSRFSVLQAPEFVANAPALSSPVWVPARAAMGDLVDLVIVLLLGFGALYLAIRVGARTFGTYAIAAAGLSQARVSQRQSAGGFRVGSQRHALRVKEWKLLRRDPWLLSQTLMQLLYLIPPALFLWISYGQSAGTYVVVIPVLVMAAGQLAGGLAWLAISGEDAHDLVVTAPISPQTILLAKIEAVLTAIAVVYAPIFVLMLFASVQLALTTAAFAALSAGSATAIQLWFRTPMRRAMFRRRQVASRAATLSEALTSIMWAGAAVLVAGDQWLALLPGVIAALVLAFAWLISPKKR